MKKLSLIILVISLNIYAYEPYYEVSILSYSGKWVEYNIKKTNIVNDTILLNDYKISIFGIIRSDSIIEFIYTDSINNYKIIGNFKIPYYCLREEIHVYNPMEDSFSFEVYEYKRLFKYKNWIFYKNDSIINKSYYEQPTEIKLYYTE